ncbi:cyclohexanone monooxygenase [Mycobacterium sp. 852013-50091_SCH5140682]|uniref:flavin-containing monooxygenase n=1 Tax=Mycobacterium sp. 852013-50091_SCH5140682 TaxID=1834109 RepID=UPI0007EAF507|nr:NAD(P)/FAD-dependent oxidoreductase [Mycobacterium sp. 852013-50091_SCH5140682]OBC14295.1 cyclohexanone monooxygenase [Mycobacterium sp. 852013-50091_SCH5140682]
MPADRLTRMPTSPSIGIIGAGPGGLALGILLKKAGFDNFTIFDREDGVGGTWRINTYPGLACDVKSHLYSYSFDLNAGWSRLWSGQAEILAYFERSARRHRLARHLKLNTEVTAAQWDAASGTWRLTTATGEQYRFDVVISAVGLFTRPVMPNLVEEEPFTGTVMHTARWDHGVRLDGARVAVLGTGSTAAQLLPELAKVAAKVYSVQRSLTWILPKPDRAYTDRERWLFAHVPFAKKVYRTRLWLRSEANISVIEHGSDKTKEFRDVALKMLETVVAEPDLRSALTPDHPLGCKRLVFSSDFIPALTRPNVEVVASPARALKARSLVTADGRELDVDVVVCATGYAATDYLGQIEVVGERGTRLCDTWRDGAFAYLGMAVPGFPNFFMLYGPNTNVGSNSVIFVLEAQARYVVRALKYLRRKRKPYVAVTPTATARFIADIDRWMQGTVWLTRCSSYFRAPSGRVVTQWPRSARAFWTMTRRFRPADYTFDPPTAWPTAVADSTSVGAQG